MSSIGNKRALFTFAVFLVLAGAAAFYFTMQENQDVFEYEDNISIGDMPGVDREELLAILQSNTDKAAVAFSINAKPQVNGLQMNLLFENPEGNDKDILLTIYENESGDVIYESKAIREGNYLATVTLLKEYAPGTYEATALITALDTETHEVIGETAAGLNIQVLES